MLFEARLFDETEVGRENVIGALPIEHFDEKRDHALGDEGIGISKILNLAVLKSGIEPDLRLTTFDQVVGIARRFRQWGQFPTQRNDVFVAILPIVKKGKFIEQVLLFFGNGHGAGAV